MNPEERRDFCPRCGVAYEPLQEYCLECGARLPTNRGAVGVLATAWQRRFAWYPGDWIWPVALFLVLTVVATAAVLVANATRSGSGGPAVATTNVPLGPGATQQTVGAGQSVTSTLPAAPQPTTTTGPLPRAPGSPSTPTPTTPAKPVNPNALAAWPGGQSGYTVVLESLPVTTGRPRALARARTAKRAGLPQVGILLSSRYSSLHAGYYAIFSGIYRTQGEASAAIARAHASGFPDAYQTRVTR